MTELRNNIQEFIGLRTEIIKSTNKQIIGQKGTIMNETKNMFLLKTKFGLKHMPKDTNTWKFSIDSNEIIIDGDLLTKRSYDRLEIEV